VSAHEEGRPPPGKAPLDSAVELGLSAATRPSIPPGGDGDRLLELYRLLLADSAVGEGGRLVCRASEERLAAKLGVTTRTIKRRIADLREPGSDPRHPKVQPAGRRLGWLKVVPKRVEGGEHKGEFVGNRYVLLLDWEEAAAAAAKLQGTAPTPPRDPAPRDMAAGSLFPAQSQGTRGAVSLPNRETALEEGEVLSPAVSSTASPAAEHVDNPQARTTRPDSIITLRILGRDEARQVITAAESWGDVPAAEALVLACRRSA
jgi:HTH domain